MDKYVQNSYGFLSNRNTWTNTEGKLHNTILFRYAKGLASADFNMPNANGVTWQPLLSATRYLDVSFTASASYTAARLVLLVRRRVPAGATGVPGTLTAEICSNSGGNPNTTLSTVTLTSSTLTDVTSEYYYWTISQALTSGTTYHVKVYGASTDRDQAHWEVGVDTTAAGLKSTAGSSWSATTYSPYYRLSSVSSNTTQYKGFNFDGALYYVTLPVSGNSQLFINGVRGRATGTQSSTTLQDTNHGSHGATSWTTNAWANAYVRIIRGTGLGQVRQITSNTADTLTVSTAWDVTPVTANSEYIVYSTDIFTEITTTGLGTVTAGPTWSNGTVYFPQGDSTNIRIMHIDYSDADCHAWDVENTNNNKAYYLTTGYDAVAGPQLWRANITLASGTPNGGAISVSRGSTSPIAGSPSIPTPLTFGTDVTFNTCILTGENTNRITNIYFHDNALYVFKENTLYLVQNDRALNVKMGNGAGTDINNGRAVCVATDKQLYFSFANDVYLLSSGGAYPTNLLRSTPSSLAGPVASMDSARGWLFAAVDGGTSNTSNIMKYALDRQSWSEQLRAPASGLRMRDVIWQDCPETRPRLWMECGSEILYQEFPLYGVRPYDDTGMKYQHEGTITLPTVDLQSVDSKYFSVLTITSQGMASELDTEIGHEVVVEFQGDNDIGTNTWYHAGYIRTSPTGKVTIGQGSTRMLRIRLRIISNEASDPIVIETVGLSLFARHQLSNQWRLNFTLGGDDEEQNSIEFLNWMIKAAQTAEPIQMLSIFPLYHNRLVTLSNEPYYNLQEYDAEARESEMSLQMLLTEVT